MADVLKIDQKYLHKISNWSMINAFIKRSYPEMLQISSEYEMKELNNFIKEAIQFEHVSQHLFNHSGRFTGRDDAKNWLDEQKMELMQKY